jgi:pimeloyl-ACP methyl ester carboxylesterase
VSRVEQESIDLPSGRFAFLRAGSGSRLLIVLHGFPDHPPTFTPLIERLVEAGYHVVAPWLRGYAPSTLEGPYHVERLAQDALELASALGHERFYLMGHDWGALATYTACALAPERVTKAITLAIPHPWSIRGREQFRLSAYVPLLAAPLGPELARAGDFAFVDALWRRWSPGFVLAEQERRALHACLRDSWPAPARYYRALFWPPRSSLARAARDLRIRVPLLHLHGAQDGCIALATTRGQARFFRAPFTSEVCPGAGHFLAREAPGWVVERALPFLARP